MPSRHHARMDSMSDDVKPITQCDSNFFNKLINKLINNLVNKWQLRKNFCAGIASTGEPRFAPAKKRFVSQILLRSLRVFGVPNAFLALGLLMNTQTLMAANLQVEVLDAQGMALPDAVVYAQPEFALPPAKNNQVAQIEQVGRKFVPLVTALQVGSQVSLPNNDTVRHHVYSFSAAKKFEVKLYSGVPSENVLFDKVGSVVLGCNIHDKMIGYIHVVDTPFFQKTDASGKAKLANLPKGKYQLKVWHFNVPQNAGVSERALQVSDSAQTLTIKVATKPSAQSGNPTKNFEASKDANY